MLAAAAALGTMPITRAVGTSKRTVWRYQERFIKEGNDAEFEEKVTALVGFYMNPPDKALVLCECS